jgi:hypothetical protein
MEVSLLSPEVMLPKLNLYPIHYRAAFAFSISHPRSPVGSPYGSLSLNFDFCLGEKHRLRENYGLTTFRVSARVG